MGDLKVIEKKEERQGKGWGWTGHGSVKGVKGVIEGLS